jgi:peptidase M28-like protein/PDZ domain-containing protein/PA domain-containing protein
MRSGFRTGRTFGLCLSAIGMLVLVGCAAERQQGRAISRQWSPKSSATTGHHVTNHRANATDAANIAAEGVSPEMFRRHVDVLASDHMEGRGIGSNGIDLAAGYIAGQLASFGVEPGGPDGSYFQQFEMTTGSHLVDDYEFRVTGADVSPVRDEDFVPFGFSSNDHFDGDVVFAGYGIVHEEKNHDDYANIDASGKVVLLLRREPPDWSGGGNGGRHASFRSKIYAAKERGAVAVLIVNRFGGQSGDQLMRPRRRGSRASFGIPAFHIRQSLAETLLSAGGQSSLEAIQSQIDGGENRSAVLSGLRIAGHAGIELVKKAVRNVIGVVPGVGPFADEYVVIGAHYDHLGYTVPMMPSFGKPRSREPAIHNGADDNASGTAGVIEAGRILAAAKPLKRSVILMAFTGEETGLIGSKYYVDHPTVPLKNIVAMLNMDMIGRLDDELTIQVFGVKAANEFEDIMENLCDEMGLELKASASAIGPSDHTSFYRKEIPALHFFTGLHEDYHRPGDDTEKVNHQGGAKATELVAATAMEIINGDARPTYFKVKERAKISGSSARSGVVMGVMPSYMDDEDREGMEIDGVTTSGPAEKAGMKQGDIITKIAGSDVKNVYDYMGALQDKKSGEVVDVIVLRDGKSMTLKVTLASR